MKKIFRAALIASAFVASPALAQNAVLGECGIAEDAPIYGVGLPGGTAVTPILVPIEQGIMQRGDRSEQLRAVPVPSVNVNGWTADYAMMRLSQLAGRPTWTMTQDGQPGDEVSLEIPATNLADAFDRVASSLGKRWRYDGEKVFLLGGQEWSMPLPASRDLAIALRDALQRNQIDARIESGVIRFQADNAGVARVRNVAAQLYAQPRLNPYDVTFYKIYPAAGEINWATLAERTTAVESVLFNGKGATLVLEGDTEAVVDAFLAREGRVVPMGSTTMVSSQPGLGSSHAAVCGVNAQVNRGVELAGGAFERGRMAMRYTVLGSPTDQSGELAVTPGSVVVIADGEPAEGAYMVAVVRPRILELQNGAAAVPNAVAPVAPAPASVVTASR